MKNYSAIIDCASMDFGGQKIFAYKYPEQNLSSNTQLNVRQGQEALLLLGGKIEKKFPPNGIRPYTLDTPNLPIVRKLFGIPFGGQNPILASVWFINKADILNIELTTNTFLLKDPTKVQGYPAIAEATFGVRVVQSEPFLLKLVNGNPEFGEEAMKEALHARIKVKVSEAIAQIVDQLSLTVADVNARLSLISQKAEGTCTDFLENYGLEFADFQVTITQDTSPEGLMMASGYGMDPSTFERQRILNIQEKAIDQISGGDNGLLGAVLAMGMVNSMNNSMPPIPGTTPQRNVTSPKAGEEKPDVHYVYCANCGKKYDSANKFCPNCGKEYRPCPKCGSDTLPDSRRCVNCGASLTTSAPQTVCPKCHAAIPNGARFCPSCGEPIIKEQHCKKCGYLLHGEKFCPNCGTKNE